MAWLTGPKKFSAAIEFLFSRQFLGWFLFASLASIAHQKRKKRHAGRYYPPVRRFYYFRFYAAVFPRRLNLSLQSGLIIVIAALSARLFLSLVSIVLTYLLCGPPSRLFCIACDISKFLTWLFLLSTIHLRVWVQDTRLPAVIKSIVEHCTEMLASGWWHFEMDKTQLSAYLWWECGRVILGFFFSSFLPPPWHLLVFCYVFSVLSKQRRLCYHTLDL